MEYIMQYIILYSKSYIPDLLLLSKKYLSICSRYIPPREYFFVLQVLLVLACITNYLLCFIDTNAQDLLLIEIVLQTHLIPIVSYPIGSYYSTSRPFLK